MLEYVITAGDDSFNRKGDPFDASSVGDEGNVHLPSDWLLVMPSDGRTLAEPAAEEAVAEAV